MKIHVTKHPIKWEYYNAYNLTVEAYPDYKNGKVRIKNLGETKCLLNFSSILRKGDEVSANPGDIIDLNFGTFLYKVQQVSKTPPVPQPLLIEERQSRLDIALKPQLSMLISEDIVESTMLNQSDGNDGTSADNSGTSRSSREPPLAEHPNVFNWQSFDGTLGSLPVLIFGENMQKRKSKVAGFDLDGTIIVPGPKRRVKGRKGSKDNSLKVLGTSGCKGLWKFATTDVKKTLTQFFETHPDHKFLIVTNKANSSYEISKRIIEEVVLELNIPVIVFAAKEGTQFLKPAPCCWEIYRKHFNEGADPDYGQSFFCGDSAGRPGDISKGDRLFALNNGMGFKTPENFFQGKEDDKRSFQMPTFIPNSVIHAILNNNHILYPNDQEIILMCGLPGSGKTWFVQTTLDPKGNFHTFSKAELLTNAKLIKATEDALAKGKSVVVDRQNVDIDQRITYIRMAKTLQIPIRCFLMNVGADQALHNIRFQELITGRILNPCEVELGYKRFKGLYEPPTTTEGFSEIISVNFVPKATFTASQLSLYSKFLISR